MSRAQMEDASSKASWTDLDSARSIQVAGKAFEVEFTFQDETTTLANETTQKQILQTVRRQLSRGARRRLGSSYRVDWVRWSASSLQLSVSANERFRTRRAASLPFAGVLIGGSSRTWPEAVDAVVEITRRAIADTLRDPTLDVQASWETGEDVRPVDVAPDAETPDRTVRERLRDLREREGRMKSVRAMFGALGGLLLGVAILFGALSPEPFVALVFAVYAVPVLVLPFAANSAIGSIRDEVRELNEQVDLRQLLDGEERRAQRLFQLHSLELKRYHDQALRQRSYVFFVGMLCILGGFGAITVAFVLLNHDRGDPLSQRILVAVLGGVGAILANFIAVLFLRMFSETMRSVVDFHNRLVVTHHVHFGNFLATRISDPGLRNQTLAAMSSALAGLHDDRANGDQLVRGSTTRQALAESRVSSAGGV